jgi:CBS-domain-containing membrane protein
LLAHHIGEGAAFGVYFANQTLIAVALMIKLELARFSAQFHPDGGVRSLRFWLHTICLAGFGAFWSSFVFPLWAVWIASITIVGGALIWPSFDRTPKR